MEGGPCQLDDSSFSGFATVVCVCVCVYYAAAHIPACCVSAPIHEKSQVAIMSSHSQGWKKNE